MSEPDLKPDVPVFAERMRIQDHIRYQQQPLLLNALGNPDVHGPTQVVGIDFRCPLCQYIQSLVPPGQEGICPKCDLRYKYTAVKSNCWLWIWRPQEKLDLDKGRKDV